MSKMNEEIVAFNFYFCSLSYKLSMSGIFEKTITETALH